MACPECRPLHGGVDRNAGDVDRRLEHPGRPLHGGVDRNWTDAASPDEVLVAPCTGAWIETPNIGRSPKRTVAPCTGAWIETITPPPPRPRSLVAPCTGAWIETRHRLRSSSARPGRPLHGGVDRNRSSMLNVWRIGCRPLHGGVDRNYAHPCAQELPMHVAPCTGAWIETQSAPAHRPAPGGRPLHGGVDRNTLVG